MTDKIRNLLTYSLLDLSENKPLSKITVSELLQKAGISKGTFYKYFRDINDLIFWIFRQIALQEWDENHVDPNADFYESCLDFFKNIALRNSFFKQACKITNQNDLQKQLTNHMLAWEASYIKNIYSLEIIPNVIQDLIEYHAYGLTHYIVNWIYKQPSNSAPSPQKAAQIVTMLHTHFVMQCSTVLGK